jgi:hypothetical protein
MTSISDIRPLWHRHPGRPPWGSPRGVIADALGTPTTRRPAPWVLQGRGHELGYLQRILTIEKVGAVVVTTFLASSARLGVRGEDFALRTGSLRARRRHLGPGRCRVPRLSHGHLRPTPTGVRGWRAVTLRPPPSFLEPGRAGDRSAGLTARKPPGRPSCSTGPNGPCGAARVPDATYRAGRGRLPVRS